MKFPVFLSVVLTVKNQSDSIESILKNATQILAPLVSDYEIIIIDNASNDNTIPLLKRITSDSGLPNLQIYALTKEVDIDTASWVGVENSLGDYVAIIDPFSNDFNFIETMLAKAVDGTDVVFARNTAKQKIGTIYHLGSWIFNSVYKKLNGVNLSKEAPQFRVLNKKIINFILQHKQPALAYRHLPATGGFNKTILDYYYINSDLKSKNITESIDKSIKLLVSTTRAPMRLVTALAWWIMSDNIKGIRIDLDNPGSCKAISVDDIGLYKRIF
ncbi:glycosyltransferase [Cellvibrio japonicus]|uniref:Glycosyl transferase, group 2 family protein n=1 Tax=Cellvibrio japonicus (strain Ueda107) TaxID=498211 RepID=B3PFZ4_CELJU|nr:glycosyltransferase [Cellvibrio japonicus]ACE83373.1 glycosyl transferase, group 2 family protein [Cellvibrio japonicus Ueda107]QEI13682.1 glycosyltransferase [Cellvibrio japonicus]QEI17256.1 glycosyltransferase [Cellvibrio japonicus]QEI20833.1 glycosyltransferase [Cellvibrio japonicus]